MTCAWSAYLNILPRWMRKDVDVLGRSSLQELRLRTGLPPELILNGENLRLKQKVTAEDLQFVINCASQYSPWQAATLAEGFLTAPGGHRIGICGTAVTEEKVMRGIREPTSLCIRVARDFPGIACNTQLRTGSVLIIGPPGSGKTTFLRDFIRYRSELETGSVSVVDERGELFPTGQYDDAFFPGNRTDILRFCSKAQGVLTVLKTMGPGCIAVDEITDEKDCVALQEAGWCGVSILATAHAYDTDDLLKRHVYRVLLEAGLFQKLVIMQKDKTWTVERMPA